MATEIQSVGDGPVSGGTAKTETHHAPPRAPAFARSHTAELPLRDASMPLGTLIDLSLSQYQGRDASRLYRLAWWSARLGTVSLQDLTDDHIHDGLEALSQQ